MTDSTYTQFGTMLDSLASEVASLQQALTALTAAVNALTPQSATVQTVSAPTYATTFKPVIQNTADIYTSDTYVVISDTLTRNIICTGTTPTQVYSSVQNNPTWVEQPDTSDGGKVWEEVHSSGQILTLYGCAPGIMLGTGPASGSTTPPTSALLSTG